MFLLTIHFNRKMQNKKNKEHSRCFLANILFFNNKEQFIIVVYEQESD